jgi:hypothetical protein
MDEKKVSEFSLGMVMSNVCAIRRKLLSPIGTRGLSHHGLAIYIKSITRQKKNYENSNISLCQNIVFKKIL